MSGWVLKGLRTGIKTTRYPEREETAPGISPGLPMGEARAVEEAQDLVSCCPTKAISASEGQVVVDYRRCIHCFRCARQGPAPLDWQSGYEWAAADRSVEEAAHLLHRAFGRSLHVLVVDGGDCGACLSEMAQLNNPYYNMHRLGFFITPTPRQADALLVVGPVTEHMRLPLRKAYEAMPSPKRVVAVGACALSGGIFGPSFISGSGVGDVLPVDVMVPGCPPPPLAILHGLLVAVRRKPPASLVSAGEIAQGGRRE